MAKVIKDRGKWCVAHSRTGQVLKRKGRRACYRSRSEAMADARETKCRNVGVCPAGTKRRRRRKRR